MTDVGIEQLGSELSGRVILPNDESFDELSQPWNRAVPQRPLAVVEVADASDVAKVVSFAGAHGLAVHVQPEGHGATGTANGSILVRTGALSSVDVNGEAGTVKVGAGASVGSVQEALAPLGLSALAGSTPAVSFVGLLLGGGLSWFGRAHGWVSDSVVSIDIVDATGQARVVTADSDPDLFWALRGGGGDFAIVTAVEVKAIKAPQISGGRVMWSDSERAAVIAAYREITANAPRELSAWLELLAFPGGEPTVAIDVSYLGDLAGLRELTAPIDALPKPLMNSLSSLRADELGTIAAEPTDPAPGTTRFELFERFDDDVADALAALEVSPLMIVQVRHLGGALAEASDSPHGALSEEYSISYFGVPFSPQVAEALAAHQQKLVQSVPVSGRKPFSFLESGESAAQSFDSQAYTRLSEIKQAVDPGGIFRSNFPILS